MVLKNVALTGASGMLGTHFIYRLIKNGVRCYSTSRTHPKDFVRDKLYVWNSWDLKDYLEPNKLDKYFPGVDAIIHAGAFVPRPNSDGNEMEIMDANIRSCLNIAKWATDRSIQMVFISGSTVYRYAESHNIKEDDAKNVGEGLGGFYGYSKWLGEKVLSYYQKHGLKLIIIRPSSIYGKGCGSDKMLMRFIQQAKEDLTIRLTPPYNDRINLVHAADVVEATLLAMGKEVEGAFNIGFTKEYSIYEIAETIVSEVDAAVVTKEGEDIEQERTRFGLNCEKAVKQFNFSPKHDLVSGIRKILNGKY